MSPLVVEALGVEEVVVRNREVVKLLDAESDNIEVRSDAQFSDGKQRVHDHVVEYVVNPPAKGTLPHVL